MQFQNYFVYQFLWLLLTLIGEQKISLGSRQIGLHLSPTLLPPSPI